MHTVELLEQALDLAERSGIVVRQDWFAGGPAGCCQVKGRQWLLLDLALSPAEQLEQVLQALASVDKVDEVDAAATNPQLQKLLSLRKAA
jgi:hypothetical protein